MLGYNAFAYCDNNPVMNVDPTGEFSWRNLAMAVLTVAVATATVAMAVCTAGTSLGVTAAVVSAAVKITVAGGVLSGGTAIVKQIAEDGDVTDLDNVYAETVEGAFVAGMRALADPLGVSSLGVTAFEITAGTICGTVDDVMDGESWRDSANKNAQENLLFSVIEWGTLKTLFPESDLGKVMDFVEVFLYSVD